MVDDATGSEGDPGGRSFQRLNRAEYERSIEDLLTQASSPQARADLAHRLGHDLGLESVEAIWDEVESLSPTHRGVTSDVLRSA